MKFYVENDLSLFEFHDSQFSYVDFNGSDLVISAAMVNIHKNTLQNPTDYDLEIDEARIVFRNVSSLSYEPGRKWETGADGKSYPVGPRVIFHGQDALERIIEELKRGFAVYHFEKEESGGYSIGGIGVEPYFEIVFDFDGVIISWDEYAKKAWYELHRRYNFDAVLHTPTGDEAVSLVIGCHEGVSAEQSLHINVGCIYEGKEYWGHGCDWLWMDAFADLQRQLPKGVALKCCLTCRHGNMCPSGNDVNELFCTKDVQVVQKSDLYAYTEETKEREKRLRRYTDLCVDYQVQNDTFYTYNDYFYFLNKELKCNTYLYGAGKEYDCMDPFELMMEYALNNQNYKNWRKTHTQMFGSLFADAFAEDEVGQIHLTAALIQISQRRFSEAMGVLKLLESICVNAFDGAVVDYFIGLDHELLGNLEEMDVYYERVKESGVALQFPSAFHPYYRTGKFAQRESECGKALRYYEKALSFLDLNKLNQPGKDTAGLILYDVATVCLYMHRYDLCEHYIRLSETVSPKDSRQRNYVKAILLAVRGEREASYALVQRMTPFFRANLEPMVDAIFAGTDIHYCVTPQDRSAYPVFWARMSDMREQLERLLRAGQTSEAEQRVSDALSEALPFMNRQLACRMSLSDGYVTVLCKNYCVKSLMNEYGFLFSAKPVELAHWIFMSVSGFE